MRNVPLSTFQTDLWTVPEKWQEEDNAFKYYLIVIDVTTRFAFVEGLRNKTAKSVTDKLIDVIYQIRNLQSAIMKDNEILFYSDFGGEFISAYTKDKLKQNNALLFVVGGEHKARK